MQIRVNAEPAAFYRLVVLISLYPQKDCPSSEHPCCVHVSHRSPSSVSAARAFYPFHSTAASYSPDTLFSAFCASSAEIIHSNWRQLFFLCLPSDILRSRYRFGAGLETSTDVLPGPCLEDCSKSYCIWFLLGLVACCLWPHPAAASLPVSCGCASCYLATLPLPAPLGQSVP